MRLIVLALFLFLVAMGLGYVGYNLLDGSTPSQVSSSDPARFEANPPQPADTDALAGLAAQDSTAADEQLHAYPSPSIWLAIALVILSITAAISVAISFYLYYWRRILVAQPNILVPEEWARHLLGVTNEVKALRKSASTLASSFAVGVKQLGSTASENSQKISDLVETFMTLQKAVDDKESEIRRLKKGYDAEIFRKFLYRFIRLDQFIGDLIKSGEVPSDCLGQIERLLKDAFDECGVEAFEPPLGADYRTVEGVADSPRTIVAEKPEDAFRIAEVLEPGYRLRGVDKHETIVPAKVKIYAIQG